MHLHRRTSTLALACATLAWLTPTNAYYEESHVTGDDVRITVDPSGAARIEHALTWRVVAGQPKTIDLVGTEPSAQPEPSTTLEGEDGKTLAASVTVVPGRGLRVTLLQPKGMRHGQQYRFKVAYAVNLVDAGELARVGSSYRLAWKAPVPSEGYEGPKVTFALPAALEAPGPIIGDDGMRDDGVVSTLKREPDHDEVSLMRPHVGRGEDVVWAVHIASKAFDTGRSAALAPPAPPPRHDAPPGPGPFAYAVLATLALAYGAAIRLKERSFAATARAFDAPLRGLVSLASWERAATGGAALFIGTSLQLVDASTAGAAAVVIAMACGVLRAPRVTRSPRGPGRWLVLRPEEAFVAAPARHLALAAFGRTCAILAGFAAFVAAGRLLAPTQPAMSLALPLDALVLVPLLATGLRSQLPPKLATRAAWLARLFRRLRRVSALRVSPLARVPTGLAEPDEVRVLVVPREPMPGLSGIEVGLAWGHASTSFVATPEVLVRVQESTAASAQMLFLAPRVVSLPGRKPEERVYRLVPVVPTRRGTAALVKSLGRRLVDRRRAEVAAGWESTERRIPPAERASLPAIA